MEEPTYQELYEMTNYARMIWAKDILLKAIKEGEDVFTDKLEDVLDTISDISYEQGQEDVMNEDND